MIPFELSAFYIPPRGMKKDRLFNFGIEAAEFAGLAELAVLAELAGLGWGARPRGLDRARAQVRDGRLAIGRAWIDYAPEEGNNLQN